MTTSGYIRMTALSLLLIFMGGMLHSCSDDDSIDSCSRRGKAQRWNGDKWTCK